MNSDFAAIVALGCPVLLWAMMWAILNGMRREIQDRPRRSNPNDGD